MATHYIETSIPSFYHEVRTAPDMVARRDWTRQWWNQAVRSERLVTSVAVLDELQKGSFPGGASARKMIRELDFLDVN